VSEGMTKQAADSQAQGREVCLMGGGIMPSATSSGSKYGGACSHRVWGPDRGSSTVDIRQGQTFYETRAGEGCGTKSMKGRHTLPMMTRMTPSNEATDRQPNTDQRASKERSRLSVVTTLQPGPTYHTAI
jgi:hypothetical protein